MASGAWLLGEGYLAAMQVGGRLLLAVAAAG
jgi:hypothetical protein